MVIYRIQLNIITSPPCLQILVQSLFVCWNGRHQRVLFSGALWGCSVLTQSTFSPRSPQKPLQEVKIRAAQSGRPLPPPPPTGKAREASGMTLSMGKVQLYRCCSNIHHTASPAAGSKGGQQRLHQLPRLKLPIQAGRWRRGNFKVFFRRPGSTRAPHKDGGEGRDGRRRSSSLQSGGRSLSGHVYTGTERSFNIWNIVLPAKWFMCLFLSMRVCVCVCP